MRVIFSREPSDLKTAFSRYKYILFWQLKTLAFHIFSQQDTDIFLDTTMVSFVGRLHNTRKTKERCQEIQGDGHAHCCYILIDWAIKSQIGKIGIFWNVFLRLAIFTYICRVTWFFLELNKYIEVDGCSKKKGNHCKSDCFISHFTLMYKSKAKLFKGEF